jgi:DNA-binding MarR family transcriptional regulator
VDRSDAEQIHEMIMDLIRVAGLLQPDKAGHDAFSMSQAFALHELDRATPLSQQALADRLMLEKSSVSRLVAELERKGFVTRERDPDNRRVYRLRLTDLGRARHKEMAVDYHDRFIGWVSAMTAAERAALVKGLPALIRVVRNQAG